MIRGLANVAATLATVVLVLFVALSGVLAGHGNNGTIKIHEAGTPGMTPNNDPKVCTFNVEGFGFDAGQSGYIQFAVQGGDAPHGTDPGFNDLVTAGSDGTFSSNYYSLAAGHYKATLYDDATGAEKAKSKVFKVTCQGGGGGGGGEGGGEIG